VPPKHLHAALAALTPLLRRTYEAVPETGDTDTAAVAKRLKQQQPNVATRLKKLWTAGLVKRDGTGKQTPYRWSRA
jgi:Mn-dependent DtxR family transcriptional regulator